MGYFVTILYIAFIFIRPQEYMEAIQGWPILDYLAGLSIVLVFLEGNFTGDKLRRSALNVLVLLFWFSLAMSWLSKFYLGGAVFALRSFAKVAIVYFLIVLTVDTKAKLRLFLWVLILMSTFLAVQAIVQFHTGEGLVGGEALQRATQSDVVGEENVRQARGIGIFADPNDLALNIVPIIAFVLPAFHRPGLSRTWVTGVIFLVPMVVGVAYTRSRGGILGLAAVGWMYMRKRLGNVLAIGGVVILFMMLLAIPRMEQLDTKEASARSRLDHWSYGLSLFEAHPLFGVGFRAFTEEYPNTAHNSFVLVFAEAGFFGALLWVAMFYCSFRDLLAIENSERAPPWAVSVAAALEAALTGWLVSAFFLSQSYKFIHFMLMAAVVATLNVLAREGVEVTERWSIKHTILSGVGAVAGIVLLHVGVRFLWQL